MRVKLTAKVPGPRSVEGDLEITDVQQVTATDYGELCLHNDDGELVATFNTDYFDITIEVD